MALSPGTKLGPYEIVALIGAGGMGEVYQARDTRLNRTVAVKALRQQISANSELKKRFEREAQAILLNWALAAASTQVPWIGAIPQGIAMMSIPSRIVFLSRY